MPKRDAFEHMHLLSPEERAKHDGNAQRYWYELVRDLKLGGSCLDVGAGNGYGVNILQSAYVTSGIDLAPSRPLKAGVMKMPVEDVVTSSYTLVTAMDVIEHVEDDAGFLAELLRVASDYVFISTPNYLKCQLVNQFHVREYTLQELKALLDGLRCRWWVSRGPQVFHADTDDERRNSCSFGVLVTL